MRVNTHQPPTPCFTARRRSETSSLAVEGELPEDGLAAYGDDGDDLMLALARKIVNGDEDEAETVESVFAHARDAETDAEEYLVDDGWQVVGAEPVAVEMDTSEGALETGAAVSGCDGGADEVQSSLFSWTEFLAGEQGRRRSRRSRPASVSFFEWALSLEQEREAELVGAGR